MTAQVAIIFGHGPRVGYDVAKTLSAQGYRIAVVSRSRREDDDGKDYLRLQADLSDPSSVESVFSSVVQELGHPSVVVYNASSWHPLEAGSSLELQIASFQSDNNVNIVSAYAATQLALQSFAALPEDSSRTFIYTGNKLPFMIVRPLLTAGAGKAAGAHLIHYLAEEHKDKGYKFYFADERKEDGDPVYSGIDGPAHAEYFSELTKHKVQGPWNATFVKGKGYVSFPEDMIHEAVTMKLPQPDVEDS